ncbi:MAG: helix-turn-helix transcriptional regulator [Clostridiales bacterium]|nr:helix-turn-helix transcriptional regulator [Candidatus Equinaster intestinalis]
MTHATLGRKFDSGKIAAIECIKNAPLKGIQIKDECFLLLVVVEGEIKFSSHAKNYSAVGPCFVCFDETENPRFTAYKNAQTYAIYFHPKFLNVNMSFELLRSEKYGEIAQNHDMFMLRPFLEEKRIIPVSKNYTEAIQRACDHIIEELALQKDWYWSCRSRSYFMEIIMILERLYGMYETGEIFAIQSGNVAKQVIMYIESHYSEDITLKEIGKRFCISHTALTRDMREETGKTVTEYLFSYRISAARKLLEFTNIPIKEAATRCGFKTVPHFSRVFKAHTGMSPAKFRSEAVEKRKNEMSAK